MRCQENQALAVGRAYLLILIVCTASLALLFAHLGIIWLPALAIALGLALRLLFLERFLCIFAGLLPVLPALAGFGNRGLPYNYLLLPLLVLAGIYIAEWLLSREKARDLLAALPPAYLLFLLMLLASVLFVFLRWSNLTIAGRAIFADTPVEPGQTRISFAAIFPVVELSLYALSVLFFLYLRREPRKMAVGIGFLCGQSLSILVSYWQNFQGKRLVPGMGHGLASDSTAFGFLTALGFLLSWDLYQRHKKKSLGLLFFIISFFGLLNSRTRIPFLAAAAVLAYFFFFEKKKRAWGLLLLSLLVALTFVRARFMKQGDFIFVSRIETSMNLVKKALRGDRVSNGEIEQFSAYRNRLWSYSFNACRSYPLSGVGAGNFLFWTRYRYGGESAWHDLPGNQYLFIAVSTGLPGLAMFLLFCLHLLRGGTAPGRRLVGVALAMLFFGDLLWSPESFLGFWLLAGLALADGRPHIPGKRFLPAGILLLAAYIAAGLFAFNALHPKNWARAANTPYAYGFSYRENDAGRPFRWSGERSGVYIYLDRDGRNEDFHIACGAPLNALPGRQQAVEVYWRGKLLRRLVFRDNGTCPLVIRDSHNREGFLEFRVRPVFNLKLLRLGEETRSLGIQVYGAGQAAF